MSDFSEYNLWKWAQPLIYLFVSIVFFGLGGYRERKKELDRRLDELEERIWEFSQCSEEYWNLNANDPKISGLATSIKQLSLRIGSDIENLNSKYRVFNFSDYDQITRLRQTVMTSPFEESGRDPQPARGDEIRKEAHALVSKLSASRCAWYLAKRSTKK